MPVLIANVRFAPRLCENSVVQFICRTSVSISLMRKTIALATSVERRKLRKQFCASLAHGRFHTACATTGHSSESPFDRDGTQRAIHEANFRIFNTRTSSGGVTVGSLLHFIRGSPAMARFEGE